VKYKEKHNANSLTILNRKFLQITGVVFFAVLLSSCAASRDQSSAIYTKSLEEVVQAINENADRIHTVVAEGSITIDSPEMYNSGSIEYGIAKPDSAYIKINGPFGISIARVKINREDFVYYNVQEGYVIKGSSTPINLGAILSIKIDYDDMIHGMSGSLKIENNESDNIIFNERSLMYEIVKTSSDGTVKKYFIDKETGNLIKYTSDYLGNSIDVEYTEYTRTGGIKFPGKIFIYNKEKKQNVIIELSDKTLNSSYLYFRVNYPSSARIIQWQ
jgi:outer membrane lipoprotein-sorting protein